jgi:dTDP-4-amino-4,6-dideoxygalactose transaminase
MSAAGGPAELDTDVEAVLECLRSGWLTMGPRTQAFEAAFARFARAPHAVAVSSDAAALELALRAIGVDGDDEVLIAGVGASAAQAAVRRVGAVPVAVDVESPARPLLGADAVGLGCTPRTRAVIVTHAFGLSADAISLRAACDERGFACVEDATSALGARLADGRPAGAAGAIGCFSLAGPGQLEVGEGGVLVSQDEAPAARARSLRSHAMTSATWDRHRGHADSYDVIDVGYNFRLDEPRAALALSRLARAEAHRRRRGERIDACRRALAGLAGVEPLGDGPGQSAPADVHLALLLDGMAARDRLRDELAAVGVDATAPQPSDPHGEVGGALPRSREATARICLVPAPRGDAEVERVVAAVHAVAG